MLKQRVVTALVLLAGLGGVSLYTGVQGFALMAAVIVIAGAWEWSLLAGWSAGSSRALFTAGFAVCLAALLYALGWPLQREPVQALMALACLWWLLALLAVLGYPGSARGWGRKPWLVVMGLLVLLPCWVAVVYLRQVHGLSGLLYVIAVVSGADIGAYFAGRAFGKRKLAPAVSPGKSWAGFWGGLTVALLLGSAAAWQGWFPQYQPWQCVLATLATALVSVLGDLLESMLKRFRGIKDSGRILPGHGGVLDRLDSLTAAAPVFVFFWLVWGGHGA